jgi:pilus assembly protein CpaC
MLEVRVAEISRNLTRQMGVNFSYTRGEDFGVSLLNNLVQLVDPDDANVVSGISRAVLNRDGVLNPLGFLNPPGLEALFRFQKGSAQWTGFVDALKENGMIKILAEPTLIALSGQTAEFLAGGEFPYPVPQGLGTVAIEYKSFGVGLAFTPTVLANDKISMKVQPEVSDLDYTTGVTIQGFTIPGINTRRVSTVIELGDGQSFSIAGLLKENVRESIAKYPFLGDIPVLGNLFKSSRFTKGETELVIIVTPHLVKPVDQEEQKLPTDYYIEPNDLDFYLLGTMWRRLKSQPAVPQAELEGDFGHSIPIN